LLKTYKFIHIAFICAVSIAPLMAWSDLDDPTGERVEHSQSTTPDTQGFIEPWMYVSVPENGTYTLRDVLEEGTDGWNAFMSYGLSIDAYEPISIFTTQSPTNYNGIVVLVPQEDCLGDFNNDDVVDELDIILFAQAYAQGDAAADLTNDGVVDVQDHMLFIQLASMGCVAI